MRNYFAIFRKIIIFALWYSAICWICSHTLRGCVDWNYRIFTMSVHKPCHTLRGCVDWNTILISAIALPCSVTPFVGVWIETVVSFLLSTNGTMRHTLRGCVDWNCHKETGKAWADRHTLRGCVDWNKVHRAFFEKLNVTPFVGVWIETGRSTDSQNGTQSHTLRGCVDWNANDVNL